MNNHRGSATEPNNGVAQTRQHLQIMEGEQVQKDGTVYRISQVLDFETVIGIAVESGRSCPLRIKELAPLNSGSVSPEQDMSEIGDADWREAEHRFTIIKSRLKYVYSRLSNTFDEHFDTSPTSSRVPLNYYKISYIKNRNKTNF